MTRVLPDRPNLDFLKNQAKGILRSHSAHDPSVCGVLRLLNRFSHSSDADILSTDIKLHDAQFALAMEYGFPSWNALKRFVESRSHASHVLRTGDEVRVAGVEALGWGKGMECSYIGALTIAARAMGRDVTYDYVMGVSGAAFKVQMHTPEWCPSAGDPTCGFDCCSLARRSLGFMGESLACSADETAKIREIRQRITASIDAGRPALAIDMVQAAEWGVITGYRGKELLCRTYFDESEEYAVAQKWPWVVLLLTDAPLPPTPDEVLRNTISAAVEMAGTPAFGNYATGFAAYRRWAGDLLDASVLERPEEAQRSLMFINAYIYGLLFEARQSAGRFLRGMAEVHAPKIGEHLLKAADGYDRVVQALLSGEGYVGRYWQANTSPLWTEETRKGEAEVLHKAMAEEERAVGELREALALI